MALDITTYVDPGVYQQEVVVPGSGSATSLPLAVGLIGVGSGVKRSINEGLIRGKIFAEPSAFAGTPAVDTLASRAIRRQSTTVVYKDGTPMANTDWQINAASITSAGAGTVDLTTKNVLAISIDGRDPIEIYFTAAVAAPAALKAGTTNGIVVPRGVATGSTTLTELAASINSAFAFATDALLNTGAGTGYGVGYATVATIVSTKLVITSPASTPFSDVATWAAFPVASDILIGGTLSFAGAVTVGLDGASHAKTILQLVPAAGLSVYLVDYVAIDSVTDVLAKANATTPLSLIRRVGNFQGMTNYFKNTDYAASTNLITWSPPTPYVNGKITSLAQGASAFNLSVNETISLSIDGRTTLDIHLAVNATPPSGWVAPGVTTGVLATEIATNVNATLASSSIYGPQYSTVATVTGAGVTAQVVLTSPTAGFAGVMELAPSLSGYAGVVIFGLASTQLPFDARGVGNRPAVGATYFMTYDYTRPLTDYNLPKQFFTIDIAFADIGVLSPTNPLAIAISLAFKNGAPSLYVIQVDDHLSPGAPTQAAVDNAMAAGGPITNITEFVMLDIRSGLMVDLYNIITTLNGPTQGHPCRAWYGMPKNTAAGDRDTPGTYIYTAVNTLSTPGDSPSRGRHILVAPSQGDVQLVLDDGTTQTVTVDGTFLAAAVAARFTARTSVAQSLVNQTINGFTNISDDPTINTFPIYPKAQRGLMADSGVCVITARAGKLILLDPLTTERGGGRLAEFEEPQLSTQKDDVVIAVNQTLATNVQGITPTDLSDFILTVKQLIGNVLVAKIKSGSIAPYRDSTGRTRDLSYPTDIVVKQRIDDQRKYNFQYFFNGRYPAKYFFGQFSVDNPFFSAGTTGVSA